MRLQEQITRIQSMMGILTEHDEWWEGKYFNWLDSMTDVNKTYMIDPNEINIRPEIMTNYQKKYDDYISGKSDRYFQIDNDDPRDIDFEKLRPVILMRDKNNGLDIVDGRHRIYLAKIMNKPVKAVIIDN
jgi:hypothetical protein